MFMNKNEVSGAYQKELQKVNELGYFKTIECTSQLLFLFIFASFFSL